MRRACSRVFPVIKAIRVRNSFPRRELAQFKQQPHPARWFRCPAGGGTGKTFDWDTRAKAKGAAAKFLAGGLTPENVGAAIRAAKPYAIDVCSGVEAKPGKKDPARMPALVQALHREHVRAQAPYER